jgi:Na+/alanine symporter
MKHYDGPIDVLLRLLVAAGLVVDAIVHFHLAGRYDGNGNTITQGDVFRIEASVALLVALVILVAPWRRIAYLVAFVVAASALGAVVLYRYVNVGSIGPLPNMYEPIWYGQKTLSAYAEGAAAVIALAGLVRAVLSGKPKQS